MNYVNPNRLISGLLRIFLMFPAIPKPDLTANRSLSRQLLQEVIVLTTSVRRKHVRKETKEVQEVQEISLKVLDQNYRNLVLLM